MKKLIIIALVILSGCYYDNEEELYPYKPDCDTTNVTFSGTILPLINSNCKVCHSGSAPEANIRLEGYATISTQAKIPAGQAGSLYGAVSHDPGNSPMPKSGTKLSDCNISKIKAWIDAGTPDN